MRTILIRISIVIFFLFLIEQGKAQENQGKEVRLAYKSALERFFSSDEKTSAAQKLEDATSSLREWLAKQGANYQPSNQQDTDLYSLLDFRLAQAWAKAGNYDRALRFLQNETGSYIQSEGRFLANTRNPSFFAEDVFELHSEIMAHTGNVTVPPGAGYKVLDVSSKDGPPSFVFVFEPVENDEGGVAIKGVEEDEQRQVIDLSAPDEAGRYKITDRAQVIGQRDGVVIGVQLANGKPSLRLNGVTKLVEYIGSGVPVVRQSPVSSFELAIDKGKIEQPIDAVKFRMSDTVQDVGNSPSSPPHPSKTNPPPSLQPSTPKKAVEAKPAPASGKEPASTERWSIIVVSIVAAIGLLWLLLKWRS